MAYTAVVTKQSVSKHNNGLFTITVQMVVNDGVADVFTGSASAKYNNAAPDLAVVKAALQAEIMEQWDKYADENGLFTAAAFDTMVGQIQNAANTYINA